METTRDLSRKLRTNMGWPIVTTACLAVMNIGIYFVDLRAGVMLTIFVLIMAAVTCGFYFLRRRSLMRDLAEFAVEYMGIQKQLLEEMDIPYAMLDERGEILWMNPAFREVVGRRNDRKLKDIFPELKKKRVFPVYKSASYDVVYGERYYRLDVRPVHTDAGELLGEQDGAVLPTVQQGSEDDGKLKLVFACLFDETYRVEYEHQIEQQKMVVGLIYLDNYDEMLESVEEVRRSLLVALIDRRINKSIANAGGIVRKTESDKYFVVMQKVQLAALCEAKFPILGEAKAVNIGNDMAATLSIGFGVGGETLAESYEYARTAIDMALGRGGDQVVVKDGETISFYGGKSEQTGKSTRVKARVKAHALEEIISSKERIMILGHKNIDSDAFGAAVGMFKIATVLDKEAHIIISELPSAMIPMVERFMNNPEYPEEMIINETQAVELADENTLMIMVDVNRSSYTECPDLIEWMPNVVVIDHHRQMADSVEDAVLSYVEPYASSTCEMVAEILQYVGDGIKLRPLEADTMYAGMMVDTNNFMNKTGVRTFEAAAFLRRNGADVTRVRKMFRDNLEDSRAKAKAISEAELFADGFAVSECPAAELENPNIVSAQAANELLNIIGIKAAFVLCEYQNQIYISARSIDEVNVQIIMERLGGGGHLSAAGAQMRDCTVAQAKELVKETVKGMIERGEI
ncbi:MAG: DHH family phosphoesterase [Lachnospiraceae bacterium]|nr:DHH family phosphoesterase [Lachnospiraceae bacterium]